MSRINIKKNQPNFVVRSIPKRVKIGTIGKRGPKGEPGLDGKDGAPGQPGQPGVGVPDGGTIGQVLTKANNDDFQTVWTSQDEIWDYSYPANDVPDPDFWTLVGNTSLTAENGVLTVEAAPGQGSYFTTNKLRYSLSDGVVFEVKLKLTSEESSGNPSYELFAFSAPLGIHTWAYAYIVGVDLNELYLEYGTDAPDPIILGEIDGYNFNDFNVYRMETRGDTAKFYINGILVQTSISEEMSPSFNESWFAGLFSSGAAKKMEIDYYRIKGLITEGAEDKHFEQSFNFQSTVIVNHNLDKYPAVTVVDSTGEVVVASVDYNNANQLTVTFNAENTGTIYCN